jgi:hypothetical protein
MGMTQTNLNSSTAKHLVIGSVFLAVASLTWLYRNGLRHISNVQADQLNGHIPRPRSQAKLQLDPSLPRSLRKDGWWLET